MKNSAAPMSFAENYPIDLKRLLATRMLIQSNSGGGKSRALRRLLEQTANQVQQLIIDPEGEFSTLREKYDYVLAAPSGADVVASPQTASLLARRLFESGVSAVLDIYELKAHERQDFVRRFLEALVNAPRHLWHPVLIVVDEAHIFCPQVGSSEAAGAMIDIATRGRKRGLCLVAATQRLAKLHKDCAAELLNKLIGRTALDVDVKRASDELGMTPREAMTALRDLDPGFFYGYGPALSRGVEKLRVGAVITTHAEAGEGLMKAPPPASPRLLKQLAQLSDLQKEAEVEARTIDELKALNADLKRKLTMAQKQRPGASEEEIKKHIEKALINMVPRAELMLEKTLTNNVYAQLKKSAGLVAQLAKVLELNTVVIEGAPAPLKMTAEVINTLKYADAAIKKVGITKRKESSFVENDLTGPEQRILDAIAWLESIGVDEPEQPAVAFLAGYSFGGGAYNNPRGRLNSKGLVRYSSGARIALTDEGRGCANFPEAPASNEELQSRVLERLNGPEQRLLRPLLEAYPHAMSNADLAAAAGYAAGAGGFNNPRGRLKTLGLIEYPMPGAVIAKPLLFPLLN